MVSRLRFTCGSCAAAAGSPSKKKVHSLFNPFVYLSPHVPEVSSAPFFPPINRRTISNSNDNGHQEWAFHTVASRSLRRFCSNDSFDSQRRKSSCLLLIGQPPLLWSGFSSVNPPVAPRTDRIFNLTERDPCGGNTMTSKSEAAKAAALLGNESNYDKSLCALAWMLDVGKETVPLYVSGREKTDPVRNCFQGYRYDGIFPSTQCSVDRFIPRRRGQNIEAAHHHLIAGPPKKQLGRVLDLPSELNRMGTAWEKLSMARALQSVVPGTGRLRLLNLSQKTSTASEILADAGTRAKLFEESAEAQEEYKWPVKPRRRPSIGQPDMILDIPNFRGSLCKNLLDWSSRNMIAAAIDHGVCVVNGNLDLNTGDTKFLFRDRCTAVSFSNSGDRIAIGRESSTTSIHGLYPHKCSYEFKCAATDHPLTCQPQAYAWSSHDRYLVVGCSGGSLEVVSAADGRKVEIIEASRLEIVSVSFSPDNRFLVSSGREPTVRIFTWPDLRLHMEIGYYAPIRATAWHPWESSLLCVGGGEGDGGLSIWNVQLRKSLAYRSVGFNGVVDTISWNKVTGEMLVNWFVNEGEQSFVALPVFASFDRITDAVVPTLTKRRIPYTMWSPDGSQIACQARESVFLYNFLDDETKQRLERRKRVLRFRKENKKSISRYNLR